MLQKDALGRKLFRQSVYEAAGSAVQALCAVIDTFSFDSRGLFIRVLQMQDGPFVRLREIFKPQLLDKLRYQRLRFWPEPSGAEIHAAAVSARNGQYAAAQAIARLENGKAPRPSMQVFREREAAQTAANYRHVEHVSSTAQES
jgi:hypothetical protein